MIRPYSIVVRALAITVCLASTASAAVLEVPQNGGQASGIGYFSGWKCPPNDDITIVVDGGAPLPVPSGVARGDTAGVCGNDGRNGFLAQINFNLYGTGQHTAVVKRKGVAFAQSTFEVTSFGTEFLTGVSGFCTLDNFPAGGSTTTVEWAQGQQNFVITNTSGGAGTEAAVRYVNELECNGATFNSILSANGFAWGSNNGNFSQYQVVTNRSFLGPFTETDNAPCGPTISYDFTLFIASGRAYTLVQTYLLGGPYLILNDDGPIELLTAGAQSTAGDGKPSLSGGRGVVSEGAGTFSAAP